MSARFCHRRAFGILAIVLCGLGACGTTSSEESRHHEVEAFVRRYLDTLESRDEAAISELFVHDDRLRWYTDGALAYTSAADVLAGMRDYAGIRFETKTEGLEVWPLDERRTLASTTFETRLEIPGQEDYRYGGVITWVLEGRAGEMRVLQGHTSTPGGPPGQDESGGYESSR